MSSTWRVERSRDCDGPYLPSAAASLLLLIRREEGGEKRRWIGQRVWKNEKEEAEREEGGRRGEGGTHDHSLSLATAPSLPLLMFLTALVEREGRVCVEEGEKGAERKRKWRLEGVESANAKLIRQRVERVG